MWREAIGITCAIVIILLSWDSIQSCNRMLRKYGVTKGLNYWCFMFFGGIFWLVYTLLDVFVGSR
jgi:hypothetical protein